MPCVLQEFGGNGSVSDTAQSSLNPSPTDESYTESPAEFKPLADTDLQKLKKEKRQKKSQKKQKAAENQSHLASVRVVQKNLVFVVGLAHRLADAEVLKRSEYFGRFGKKHKIVINQSTSYAGAQGPSASAYVTFYQSEDAIQAVVGINNVTVDGRTIKASLGINKYCTFFLRGLSCTKADCEFLHELGDELGSFTKEQMQQGKHLEYEQMLYDECNQNIRSSTMTTSVPQSSSSSSSSSSHQQPSHNQHIKTQTTRPVGSSQKKFPLSVRHQNSRHSSAVQSTKGWSSRNASKARANCRTLTKGDSIGSELQLETGIADKCLHGDGSNSQSNASTNCRNSSSLINSPMTSQVDAEVKLDFSQTGTTPLLVVPFPVSQAVPSSFETEKTSAGFQTEFDPWNESTKGLADMMEKENNFLDNKANPFNPPNPLKNLLDGQNRTLTLKQLSVANVNEGLSPTHSSWPPTSSTLSSSEYRKLYLVLDTNTFLDNHGKYIFQLKSCMQQRSPSDFLMFVIPWVVFQELDVIKDNRNHRKTRELQKRAQKAVKAIHRWLLNKDPGIIGQDPRESTKELNNGFTLESNDDRILKCCLQFKEKYPNEYIALLSFDMNLRNKSMVLGIDAYTRETLEIWLRNNFPTFQQTQNKDRDDADDGSPSDDDGSLNVDNKSSSKRPPPVDFGESSGPKPCKRARFSDS